MTSSSSSSSSSSLDLDQLLAKATASLKYAAQQRRKQQQQRAPDLALAAPVAPPKVTILKLNPHLPPQALQPHAGKRVKATADSATPDPTERTLQPARTFSDPVVLKPTTGDKWFNMPAGDLTPEIKNDLFILKHRDILDTKRHYKKDKSKTLPKFFQVGRVVEAKHEFYSARMTKKERKNTLVDELLKDTERRRYFKRKAEEISEKKAKGTKKWFAIQKAKRKRVW